MPWHLHHQTHDIMLDEQHSGHQRKVNVSGRCNYIGIVAVLLISFHLRFLQSPNHIILGLRAVPDTSLLRKLQTASWCVWMNKRLCTGCLVEL